MRTCTGRGELKIPVIFFIIPQNRFCFRYFVFQKRLFFDEARVQHKNIQKVLGT